MQRADDQRVDRILEYCTELGDFAQNLGYSFEAFSSNTMALRAVGMDLLQIGELCGTLSDSVKAKLGPSIPWKEIRAARNWLAHAYAVQFAKLVGFSESRICCSPANR